MHIAEILKPPCLVECPECLQKAVALGGRQAFGILANSYHTSNSANHGRGSRRRECGARFNGYVAVVDTGFPAGDKEWHRSPVYRDT